MTKTVLPNRLACLDDTYKAVDQAIKGSKSLMHLIGKDEPVLAIYGSTVNSLAQNADSDLDLTFLVDDYEVSHETILRLV